MKREKYKGYIAVGVTAFCVIAAGLFLFFALLHADTIVRFAGTVSRILRPILYGMVLAFLLLPIHRNVLACLESIVPSSSGKHGGERSGLNFLAILFSMLVAAVAIYLLLVMVVPQVYFSIVGFVQAMPGYIEQMQAWVATFLAENPEIETAILNYYNSALQSLQDWLQKDLLPNLESVSSTITWIKESILPSLSSVAINLYSGLFAVLVLLKDLFVAVIVSVYLLMKKDVLAAQSKKIVYSIFPPHIGDLIVRETRDVYRILSGFITGKLLDSLLIGIIALVCCNLLKFPYPALLATIIGVTNVIPFFGPFIGAVPCALLILVVNPLQCVYFVIFILVLQQFDGNILGPKILGDSTGIDAFWVIFSILLFSGLFGFVGMVLGVPVFAMFFNVARRLVRHGLRKHGLPENTKDYIGKTGPMAK